MFVLGGKGVPGVWYGLVIQAPNHTYNMMFLYKCIVLYITIIACNICIVRNKLTYHMRLAQMWGGGVYYHIIVL